MANDEHDETGVMDETATGETPEQPRVASRPEVVMHMSVRIVEALGPLPTSAQLSIACTVLMNLLVLVERAVRERPPATEEERADLAIYRATTLDAVTRIGQCYAVMQQADTVEDLEQSVRLFEDHPGAGKVN